MEEGFKEEEEGSGKELHLKSYVIGSLPTIIYIPNFISKSEHAQLLHHIYEVPTSRWKSLKNRRLQNWGGMVHEKGLLPQDLPPWLTKFTQRICSQTELFPSAINHVLINEYLPDQGIMPHQDGPAYFPVVAILSLESPVIIDFTPHAKLKERTDRQKVTGDSSDESIQREQYDHQHCHVLLMPCSLLIFKDQAYSDYLHGIQDSEVHRLDKVVNSSEITKLQETPTTCSSNMETHCSTSTEQSSCFHRTSTRVSLTCRLVLKIHKNLFKF